MNVKYLAARHYYKQYMLAGITEIRSADVRAATFPSEPHLLPRGTLSVVKIYLTTELCSSLKPDVYKNVKGTENVSFKMQKCDNTLKCSTVCVNHEVACPRLQKLTVLWVLILFLY